jgi:predicted transcriptional regulator
MRILADLEEAQIEALDQLAARSKTSRAALIREAIAAFLGARREQNSADAFGLWGERTVDGLAYERKVRSEW